MVTSRLFGRRLRVIGEAGLLAAWRAKHYGALRDVVRYLPFPLIVGLAFVPAALIVLDLVSFALERTAIGLSTPPQPAE
ncbi:MAG TPA: hypothetical protein VFS93_06895 [Terrimesophilobacter sp.]|nr:hypothetical protein [Terrimesophilobacter sp.]